MEEKAATCCEDGSRVLKICDNDQNADPGWLHVRMTVTSIKGGAVGNVRVRHCPFCGHSFVADLEKYMDELSERVDRLLAEIRPYTPSTPTDELELVRAAIELPKEKPIQHIAPRVADVVAEAKSWRERSTDYEQRWAKLCDMLGVSYAATPDTALNDVQSLLTKGAS